ncbi:MAG TPA: peptide deformylase [Saprospiraceae bacterium]|nr:peptide deformylase [Saprospiraceae bacterium]
MKLNNKVKVIKYPNSVLTLPNKKLTVEQFDDGYVEYLSMRLEQANRNERGLGVVAPQIGINQSIFYISVHGITDTTIVNPRVIDTTHNYVDYEEGCLSIPGFFWDVSRPDAVKLEYQTLMGDLKETWFDGLIGRVIFHEMDHLYGRRSEN